MQDSSRHQFLQVTGNRTAALILEYFLVLHNGKRARNPDEPEDSPKLWIDFTQDALAKHFLVSVDTVSRAMKILQAKRFIHIHQFGYDRTYRYELKIAVINSVRDEMPLFEGENCHPRKMRASIPAKCGHASPQNAGFHPRKMPDCYPSIPSFVPSSSSGVEEDETDDCSKETPAVVLPVPDDATDPERQDLLDQCEAVGIHPEHTEALLLARTTRQTVKAAFAHLAVRLRRGDRIPQPYGGFIIDFCRDPKRWEHGVDEHGCWVPLRVLAEKKKQRRQAKARDRPDQLEDARRAAFVAWDRLSYAEQTKIKEQIEAEHPELSAGKRIEMCRQEALNRSKHADDQAADDTRPEQRAPRPAFGAATRSQ
ncbi:MAG: hypothetical protein JNJ77_19915 [Planctomycetia bacterium]|nr:hypothetical protein [Planctomycetia bacterium]